MKISEVLKSGRELLAKPNGWTVGELATDSAGLSCEVTSPKACSFCSIGAVSKVAAPLGDEAEAAEGKAVTYLRAAAYSITQRRSVVLLNDNAKDVNEVLAMWDKAIELAEKDENAAKADS